MKLLYLSIPYSHPHRITLEQRVLYADFIAAEFLKHDGINVISPITHSHRLVPYLGTSKKYTSWNFWKDVDMDLLDRCDCMVVCQIKGWKESVGVTAEIQYCVDNNIPVFYLNFDENCVTLRFERLEEIVEKIRKL